MKVLGKSGDPARTSGPLIQVSRMGNPLVNELIINTPLKDRWNGTEPENEAQFQGFYKDPVIGTALQLVYGVPVVPIFSPVAPNRTDLMTVLLKYAGQPLDPGGNCGNPCAELLRLDVSVFPTPAENQSRPGAVLGGDGAGWPNGRRPNDDVTDIAIQGWAARTTSRRAPGTVGTPGRAPGVWASTSRPTASRNFPFLPTPPT
jgi:hypothetical protein